MVKILLVDDDNTRIRTISSCIEDMNVEIDCATSKQNALVNMGNEKYDLVIIDIMLPENISAVNPSKNAGVELIEDIEKLKKIKKPANIIGITSDEEVYNAVKHDFDDRLIPIINWSIGNDDWKKQLRSKIEYLNKLNEQQTNYKVDVVIITAVDDEYDAVKRSMENWKELYLDDDPCIYHLNSYVINEMKKDIMLVKLPDMGMTAASNICTKVILKFSPDKIIMVGICGGIQGKVELGDIVVASTSWDYGNGKIKPQTSSGGTSYYEFEAAPNQIPSSYSGFEKIKISSKSIIDEIKKQWNNTHYNETINPAIHIGPMPTGSSVICDKKLFEEIIKPQHRKCIGLDMETYAVYFSAKNTTDKSIDFLSIKCVSDYADEAKDDSYHERGCYTSANFAIECLKNGII